MTESTTQQKWLDEMILELRLLNVDGARIGDAAATVRHHLAESGENPDDAFGDPVEYARSLGLAQPEPAGLKAVLAVNMLGLFGFMALVFAAGPASRNLPVEITGFHVVLDAVYLLALPLVALNLGTVVRLKARWAWVAGAGVMAVLVVAGVFLHDALLFTVPALPVAVAGGALTLAAALWGQFSGQQDPDPLVDPLEEHAPTGKRAQRRADVFSVLGTWSLVIAAAVMVPLSVWLQHAVG